jgi:hypothetical protein
MKDRYGGARVSQAELGAVDWDQLDRETWPLAELDELPYLTRWRVVDALCRVELVLFRSQVTEARLRLWRAGKRTDDAMGAHPPAHVHVPPWVNALLAAEGGVRLLLDPGTVAAAEAAVALSASQIDAMVAVRGLLAGEPPPLEGGWLKAAPGAQDDGHDAEDQGLEG